MHPTFEKILRNYLSRSVISRSFFLDFEPRLGFSRKICATTLGCATINGFNASSDVHAVPSAPLPGHFPTPAPKSMKEASLACPSTGLTGFRSLHKHFLHLFATTLTAHGVEAFVIFCHLPHQDRGRRRAGARRSQSAAMALRGKGTAKARCLGFEG